MTSPAEPGYQIKALMDRIALLETQVGVLMRGQFGSGQKAVAQAYAGGAMLNVKFQASGNILPVPFLYSWTPPASAGTGVVVVDFGGGYFLAMPVSSF